MLQDLLVFQEWMARNIKAKEQFFVFKPPIIIPGFCRLEFEGSESLIIAKKRMLSAFLVFPDTEDICKNIVQIFIKQGTVLLYAVKGSCPDESFQDLP